MDLNCILYFDDKARDSKHLFYTPLWIFDRTNAHVAIMGQWFANRSLSPDDSSTKS